MNTESWKKVKEILDRALDLPEDEVSAFLDETCGEDAELRTEVDSLLRGRSEAEEFIEEPVVRLSFPESQSEAAGTRFGAYEVQEVLGRGGMGTVYLARRADGVYEAKAALKILHRGMDTDEIVRRFESERQILASLKHPYIGELLDGGSTDDGRPYLVMEYIDGTPVDQFCDQLKWGVRRRLQLFQRVCQAVEHAHRAMVVHRDLKPANILVLEDGTPKLLDFGIAKLLAPDAATTVLTQGFGPRIFTPGYASPEQLRGEPVGAATDTYSLGVLLYQLLTGRRPYPIPEMSPERAGETLMDFSIERPSTAVRRPYQVTTGAMGAEEAQTFTAEELSLRRSEEPRSLQRLLAGDLDSILLKALRPEPEERYSSVADLSRDIDAYLEDRPVEARLGTLRYRSSKFLRRHRISLIIASGLITLLGYGTWQQWTAIQERQRTEEQRVQALIESEKAQVLEDFMTDLFAGADPDDEEWRDARLMDILQRATELMPERLEDQSEVRANLLSIMGRVYQKLSDPETAQPLLEDALKARQKLFGDHHEQVAFSQIHLGKLMLDVGEYHEAERLTRLGIETLKDLAPESQAGAIAMGENNLAWALQNQGALLEAEKVFRRLLETKRETSGAQSNDFAVGLHNLAGLLNDLGRKSEAVPFYEEAIEIRRSIGDGETMGMSKSLGNLGILLMDQGRFEEAEPLLREALEIRRKLLGPLESALGAPLNNWGLLRLYQGFYGEAEKAFAEQELVFRKADFEGKPNFAVLLCNQARLDLAIERWESAAEKARRALEIYTSNDSAPWRQADAMSLLGQGLAMSNRPEEAEALLLEGYETLAKDKAVHNRQFEEARARLGHFYESQGEDAKAAAVAAGALEILLPDRELVKVPAQAPL